MADYGLSKALTVDMGFDQRINDARYDEMLRRQIQSQNEAKAKLFADDLNYQNAANPFDNPLIKKNNQDRIKAIGRFVRENPDWNTNVDKLAQLNAMKRELRDNPDLIRGVAVDQEYKKYLADLAEVAKNPQYHDTQAYEEMGKQFQNYFATGNKSGDPSRGIDAPVYVKPRDFVDLNERWKEIGNSFKDVKPRPIKGGRNAYEEYADPNSLNAVAMREYEQNKRQYDIEAARQNKPAMDIVREGINAHIPKKRDFGDYGLSDAMALARYKKRLDGLDVQTGPNAYQEAFVARQEGVVAPEYLEQTYGSKPRNIIYNNDGTQQIDNTGNRVYYTGVHKWLENGGKRQKVVETYTYLTPEQAKEKGIYDDGAWNPFKGEEIVPEWNRNAEIITTVDKSGNEVKAIKVKSLMPVELNEAYAGAFNNAVHIAKSKIMSDTPNEGTSDIPSGTVNEWKAAGWSDDQIRQGQQEGKIRVK